jgi:hypothetical protein
MKSDCRSDISEWHESKTMMYRSPRNGSYVGDPGSCLSSSIVFPQSHISSTRAINVGKDSVSIVDLPCENHNFASALHCSTVGACCCPKADSASMRTASAYFMVHLSKCCNGTGRQNYQPRPPTDPLPGELGHNLNCWLRLI